MRRAWVLATALLSALALHPKPAAAYVSSSGTWILIKSLHGEIGGTLTGGDYSVTHTMGEPFIAISSMIGPTASASTMVITGYLSQVPSNSTGSSVMTGAMGSSATVTSGGVVYGVYPQNATLLTFNNEMSSTSLAGAITVTAVLDPLGNAISAPQAYTLAYSATQQIAYVNLPGGWAKGTTYVIAMSTAAKDINGTPLSTTTAQTFAVNRDYLAANTLAAPGDPSTTIEVPGGAFPSDYFILMSTGVKTPLVVEANDNLEKTLGPGTRPLKVVLVEAFTGDGAAWTSHLAANARLNLPFTDADGDGRVDGTDPPVRSKSLAVWRLNEDEKLWVREPASRLDLSNGRIILPTNHFSHLAAVGEVDTDTSIVYAFPVPFRPNANNSGRYGTWAQGIRFTNLPQKGQIRIFTPSGRLVREIEISANPQSWDVKNSAGEVVSSGLYLWEVVSGENRKTGKLAVIR